MNRIKNNTAAKVTLFKKIDTINGLNVFRPLRNANVEHI